MTDIIVAYTGRAPMKAQRQSEVETESGLEGRKEAPSQGGLGVRNLLERESRSENDRGLAQ